MQVDFYFNSKMSSFETISLHNTTFIFSSRLLDFTFQH